MKVVQVIINIVTVCMLAFVFVGAGFMACVAPPTTHALSTVFANDATSPLDRNQLVRVADATRDYSFGSHDLLDLYRTIYDIDVEYRNSVGYSAASTTGVGFPKVDAVTDRTSTDQYATAFRGASELYCYSPETIAHLDDCYKIASTAYPLLIAAAILVLAGLVFTGVACRKRRLGIVLIAAGAIVILSFVALGAWAVIDFRGFFTAFHNVFFSQGNWTFPYDSLLICALPQPFWAGMGALWLLVALLEAVLSILIGRRLAR